MFAFGNRSIHRTVGRNYDCKIDGQVVGNMEYGRARSWLYEAQPYELKTYRCSKGYEGVIVNRQTQQTIAALSVYWESETEAGKNEAWKRLQDWASGYNAFVEQK